MGWNARMKTGITLRQNDGIKFTDIKLDDIQEMWLDGLENLVVNRNYCPGFLEFIQFESARSGPTGIEKLGQFLGWTNGEVEFIVGYSKEKHTFHPDSNIK